MVIVLFDSALHNSQDLLNESPQVSFGGLCGTPLAFPLLTLLTSESQYPFLSVHSFLTYEFYLLEGAHLVFLF